MYGLCCDAKIEILHHSWNSIYIATLQSNLSQHRLGKKTVNVKHYIIFHNHHYQRLYHCHYDSNYHHHFIR